MIKKETSRKKIKSQELVPINEENGSDRNLPKITTTTLDSIVHLENRRLDVMEGQNQIALSSLVHNKEAGRRQFETHR